VEIERLILGAYETNCYVLRASGTAKDCLVIDPGLEAASLVRFLHERRFNAVATVLTHGHIDHMAGVAALRAEFPNMKVYIHELDADMLADPQQNLSAFSGATLTVKPADSLLKDKSIINQADVELEVLHTPGHTPGGICLYSKNDAIVFTDDTLFADSVGRTDFPGGNMTELITGIKEKLLTLPGDTKAYPGHGPVTTIAHEKAHNPFLQ
jgi:hydroxyacylglutathione hydrolase